MNSSTLSSRSCGLQRAPSCGIIQATASINLNLGQTKFPADGEQAAMREKITGPADWRGPAMEGSSRWMYHLDDADVAEIDAALRNAKAEGATLADLCPDDFPLPRFSDQLRRMGEEIENGCGLFLFRGLPTDRYDKNDLRLMYWGLGLHVGTAVSQSKRGDFLGDVRDLGTGLDGPEFRGYTSSGELTYHCDAADVTGLFCLHPAKIGGLSRIVSAVAVHNQILETRPDLLEVLYQPYYWSMQGNERPGEPAYYTQPIFAVFKGAFASRYTRTHIRSAEMMADLPGLTPEQAEALTLIDEICARPEFHLTIMFEPGDIQFLNNHLTLHTRTAFEDHADPARKRHLLRLWLSVPNSRALDPGFAPFYRDVSAGAVRGGHPGHGDEPVFTTI